MMQEDRAQYLLLIVDVNPLLWMSKPFTPNGRSAFFDFIDQLFMFINAFSLLNRENKIAVIATHPDQNEMVFRYGFHSMTYKGVDGLMISCFYIKSFSCFKTLFFTF